MTIGGFYEIIELPNCYIATLELFLFFDFYRDIGIYELFFSASGGYAYVL